jgi:hypothetical protein
VRIDLTGKLLRWHGKSGEPDRSSQHVLSIFQNKSLEAEPFTSESTSTRAKAHMGPESLSHALYVYSRDSYDEGDDLEVAFVRGKGSTRCGLFLQW